MEVDCKFQRAYVLPGFCIVAIFTINSGSSSLKFGLYDGDGERLLLSGKAEEVGHASGILIMMDAEGREIAREENHFPSQEQALAAASTQIARHSTEKVTAIGHRIVHGGPHLGEHCALTAEVLATLERSVHFAPLHIPSAVALIRASEREFPGVPQFACFDTQFHNTMPPEAYTYPLPRAYRDAGVRRYGFHGLSYEAIVRLLGDDLPGKLIVAHLGSGCSICAIAEGKSIDTSMGLSPTGGVPMATRSGDLDPAVGLLLQRKFSPQNSALTPDELEALVNHGSGLEALAGESDMRLLMQRAASGDAQAMLATDIFARSVAKTIAAYATVLGGFEMLVFTGGIGEHGAPVRKNICARLATLGVEVASESEAEKTPGIISKAASRVKVRVMTTDEDGQIARHVARMSRLHA